MPFYEGNFDAGKVRLKENVGLTQLRLPREKRSGNKTWFTTQTSFWSANTDRERPHPSNEVPAYMETDLASVSKFMWGLVASYGPHTMPALVHDHACEQAGKSGRQRRPLRRVADKEFRQNLDSFARMHGATRWLMWSAVRIFGARAVIAPVLLTALLAHTWLSGVLAQLGLRVLHHFQVVLEPEKLPHWYGAITTAAGIGAAVGAGLLLIAIVFVSVEPSISEDPSVPWRVRGEAFGSIAGAALIGLVAAGPLLPLIVVTIASNFALSVLDLIFWLPGALKPLGAEVATGHVQQLDLPDRAGTQPSDGSGNTDRDARPRIRFFPTV